LVFSKLCITGLNIAATPYKIVFNCTRIVLIHGLVNAVLPDAAALHAHAQQLALTIASKSPLAVSGSKRALNYARDHGSAEALQQMTLLQSAIFDPDEMNTAIQAWKTKRRAEFAALAPIAKL